MIALLRSSAAAVFSCGIRLGTALLGLALCLSCTTETTGIDLSSLYHQEGDRTQAVSPYRVRSRADLLEDSDYWPCTDCHDGDEQPVNPEVRELEEEHDEMTFTHGKERFWCYACHQQDADELRLVDGKTLDFDEGHQLCGQCHFREEQDFVLGIHGKTLSAPGTSPRLLEACTACHDPHHPRMAPRAPMAGPKHWTFGRPDIPQSFKDKVDHGH